MKAATKANGDADLLIVKTAVESARTSIMVLVGDDTDLLVLLCYHASEDGYDLYFRPEPKANVRGARVWHMKPESQRTARQGSLQKSPFSSRHHRIQHNITPLRNWQGNSPEEI